MNVLIFGGTGFVGRNLTDELLTNGYQVFVITRNHVKAANDFVSKVKIIESRRSKNRRLCKNVAGIKAPTKAQFCRQSSNAGLYRSS